jgi:hypothetical protein
MNSNEIHPDLEGILEEAKENVLGPMRESVTHDFGLLEEQLFKKFGSPEQSEVWALKVIADNKEESDKYIAEHPDTEQLNGSKVGDGNEDGLMSLENLGEGEDIYDGLSNMKMASALQMMKGSRGVLVRVGAWASAKAAESGERPSESDDKRETVITMMITNGSILTACRFLDDDKVEIDYKSVGDYNYEESKLTDALMTFWFAPQQMKAKHPKIWAAMEEEIMTESEGEV